MLGLVVEDMIDLPWRWWIWLIVSYLMVVRVTQLTLPEDSRLREVIFVSVGMVLAWALSLLIEGIYQLFIWLYEKYIKKGKEE